MVGEDVGGVRDDRNSAGAVDGDTFVMIQIGTLSIDTLNTIFWVLAVGYGYWVNHTQRFELKFNKRCSRLLLASLVCRLKVLDIKVRGLVQSYQLRL